MRMRRTRVRSRIFIHSFIYSTHDCTAHMHTHTQNITPARANIFRILSIHISYPCTYTMRIVRIKIKGGVNIQFRFYLMKYVRRGVASIPTSNPFQVRRRSCISQTCILSHSSATVLTSSFYDHAHAHSCNMKINLNSLCASMTMISVYIYIVKSNNSIRDDQSAKQSS